MSLLNTQQALQVALAAAGAGAVELMSGYGARPAVRHKGAIDLVTEYDFRSEAIVRQIIAQAYPDHFLVGEEEGGSGEKQARFKWYIDPLDGTTNFSRGHPFFAVSIGLVELDDQGGEVPLVGVIQAPALGELYWARRGGGAWRRQLIHGRGAVERRLAVSSTNDLGSAFLNTGFPYNICERGPELMQHFNHLVLAAQSVRRAGAASLDLAYLAAGVADAFWESGLKPWDVAAGLILVSEAGGRISDYQGDPYRLGASLDILATNAQLHQHILTYLH